MMKVEFPIGFQDFHKDKIFNFMLNRWYSSGAIKAEDLIGIDERVKDFKDWKAELIRLGEAAEKEERYLNAATYYRAAEFISQPTDPDKNRLYENCTQLYRLAYRDEPIEYLEVPYGQVMLPVMKLSPSVKVIGNIIIHGGYDSLIEEFYPIATLALERGYQVYLFEGPGQGKVIHKYQLKMTHEWEKPVKAILDYFNLENATLIGVSLGGYLAARAAAYEPRIKRVVLYDIIYDFYQAMMAKKPIFSRIMTELLMKLNMKKAVNRMDMKLRKISLFVEWLLMQGYYVFGVDNLFDYIKTTQQYSTIPFNALIKQDVLLLAGEDDIYTVFFDKQKAELKNARTVEGRIFTRKEHASHHCQVGNLKLTMDYILDWVTRKS